MVPGEHYSRGCAPALSGTTAHADPGSSVEALAAPTTDDHHLGRCPRAGGIASGMAYFDAASAHPLHPAARATLLAAHDAGWADPTRLYREARRARMLLDQARESVATVLDAHPDEISFCASGTQACHLAVLGALAGGHRAGRRVVMSAVEHSAVLQAGACLLYTSPSPRDRS